MRIIIYDFEVFRYDWLVVFKEMKTAEYTVIHNNSAQLKSFMESDMVFTGFNVKHYDNHILKAILCGANNALAKEINDFIIHGNQGFDHWFLKENKYWFESFDIKDDMQKGLSLKAIEGHFGSNIEESSVPFNIDRPLTQKELDDTIFYCKHDVDEAEKVVKIRKDYLQTKLNLGRIKGLADTKALYMTNAKLTAAYLGASKRVFHDERDYVYPDNLLMQYIQPEVLAFFNRVRDPTVPSNDKLWKGKYVFNIGECKCKVGFGGIHGAIPNYRETAQGTRTIRNKDVASYYPHLVTIDGYCSRAMSNPSEYEEMLERRMAAKKAGDKLTASALKLVCNTTYGAMLNKYNDLYDPKMGRSVCITGQLRLLELANHLVSECPTLKIVQLNTDGIMISLDDCDVDKYQEISQEWQERTGFTLEEDYIQKIIQKDVNNYIEVPTGELYDDKGRPRWKKKGGYFVRGIPEQGAWNINNNATIVATALQHYFIFDTPVEITIQNCNDISCFQFIAKAGGKYNEAYQVVDGEKITVQRVNRVYATKDERYGTLTKVEVVEDEDETGDSRKIEMLPEHCIIDNDNHLSISDVDKDFYIEVALSRINDFLGIKTKKKGKVKNMATKVKETTATAPNTEGMAFLQKLFLLQTLMDEYEWEKDGKNMHQQYKFISEKQYKNNFKMARRKAGLLWECENVGHNITLGISDKMHLMDADFIGRLTDPATGEHREYRFSGTGADNGDKALYKAYTGGLKFFLANQYLVAEGNDPENDEDDAPTTVPEVKKADKKPATKEERSDIKDKLTDKDGNATPLQIEQLKKALSMLRDADPDQEEFITQVAERTEGFKVIPKATCEQLIIKVGEMIDEAKAGAEE